MQNIWYKTLFAKKKIAWNTWEFFNFVGNNYPQSNYVPIKILRNNGKKKCFLAIVFNKFAKKKSYVIWKVLVVIVAWLWYNFLLVIMSFEFFIRLW